ncbi:hypothetical protein SDC9_120141 [bioreactor metagenome]|uniref:Uncharacterized protein n=1 Tax=bioreactor metagenome TaxID=1076179 RepID=A0A645C6G6_9ZZZZ
MQHGRQKGLGITLAPGGFGRALCQVGILHQKVQQRFIPVVFCRSFTAFVPALFAAGHFGDHAVHQHVTRPGVKGNGVAHRTVRRQKGDVADAADVLQRDVLRFAAVDQILGIRHQRCPLPTGGNVPHAEVGHHDRVQLFADRRHIADLQCGGHRPAKVLLCQRLVVHRLPMAADQIDHRGRNARFGTNCLAGLQIQLPQNLLQHADGVSAAVIPAGHAQNFLAHGIVKRHADRGALAHHRVKAMAGDLHQHGVHGVRRRAAHQADHQLILFLHQLCKAHPLTPPRAMPSINCFCIVTYSANGMANETVAAAMLRPSFVSCCELSSESATVKVYILFSVLATSGHKKLFQQATKVKMVSDTSAGWMSGRMILKKILYSGQPSICAASM